METLQYPIGRLQEPATYSPAFLQSCIHQLETLPKQLRARFGAINPANYHIPYRPNGWNALQLVNHFADSHMNAYIRTNLTLTEDYPTVKPYREELWAAQKYLEQVNIDDTLQLIELLHKRWVALCLTIKETDFERKFYHPESKEDFTLKKQLNYYAWHCRHHLAHLDLIAAA